MAISINVNMEGGKFHGVPSLDRESQTAAKERELAFHGNDPPYW